jgi:hypothetical protein
MDNFNYTTSKTAVKLFLTNLLLLPTALKLVVGFQDIMTPETIQTSEMIQHHLPHPSVMNALSLAVICLFFTAGVC